MSSNSRMLPSMQLIPYTGLDDLDRDLGAYVFALIRHWSGWVHRRVETVRFKDAETFERRTSIDFTLSSAPTPLWDSSGSPIHCVPLAVLRKRPQRGFDVRDESGRAMPVYSRAQNGPVSAGVLWAAAEALVGAPDDADLGPVPNGLVEDFWHIAHRSPRAAQQVWESLGRPRSVNESKWRSSLVISDLFMQLALDLTRNFLVLVPLTDAAPGERRVLKFSYEEQRTPRPGPPGLGVPRRNYVPGSEGQGRIAVSVATTSLDSAGQQLPAQPENGMEIRVWRCTASGEREGDYQRLVTDGYGRAIDGFPVGHWEVEAVIPPGLMEMTPRVVPVIVDASKTSPAPFQLMQIADRNRFIEPAPEDRDERRLRRGLGWVPKPIVIRTPGVGTCASFHLEFEAPEEMAVTRGELSAATAYIASVTPGANAEGSKPSSIRQNVDHGPVQRAHLHLDGVSQGETGAAFIALRSQPATILRPALMSSFATTLLLLVVAFRFPQISTNVGSVAAALLFVPGLLTAYVVRPREHPMATSLLFGHRLMAVTSSVCALAAAMLLLVEREWRQAATGQVMLEDSWEWTRELLWVLTGASALSVVLILVALRLSAHPPESTWKPRPAPEVASSPSKTRKQPPTPPFGEGVSPQPEPQQA